MFVEADIITENKSILALPSESVVGLDNVQNVLILSSKGKKVILMRLGL